MLELQERQNLSSGEMLAGISTALAELQEVSPVWLATGKRKKKCKRTNKPQRAQKKARGLREVSSPPGASLKLRVRFLFSNS